MTLRRPHQDRSADLRLRLVASERAQQRRVVVLALAERTTRVAELAREPQREREIDEARLAREYVAGLCGATRDHDRCTAVAGNRAARHRRHRGREDLRLDDEWHTAHAVRACCDVEAVMQ